MMADSQVTSPRSDSPVRRTIGRILLEAVAVALVGATVLGIVWEMNHFEAGLIAAIVIWVAGAPFLEILRVLQGSR